VYSLDCEICGKTITNKSLSHISRFHGISIQQYYDTYLKLENEEVCEECSKVTRFQSFTLGYARFCSRSCSNKNETTKQKIQDSFIRNFGDNPMRIESIKIKRDKTFFKHFGVNNPSQHDSIKKLKSETYRKHYGVDHYSQSMEGRRVHRLNSIRLVENQKLNGEPLSPKVGYQEKPFFDELQKYCQCEIIRNDDTFRYGISRYPDGHIPELKIFIQFDERFHFKDRHYKKYHDDDIRCTLELASLGYLVFRVSEYNWKTNKEMVIKQFKEIIKWQNVVL